MDQDPKEIKNPEVQPSLPEKLPEVNRETQATPEKKEISPDEKVVTDELRKEIEMMEVDDKLKSEAEAKAKKIEFLGEKEKIEHLLQIAREKGVIYAIAVAKKMNDPYILDILHDILAKEGYYKDLTK